MNVRWGESEEDNDCSKPTSWAIYTTARYSVTSMVKTTFRSIVTSHFRFYFASHTWRKVVEGFAIGAVFTAFTSSHAPITSIRVGTSFIDR